MTESNAFFTQTIVGAPHSVVLGRRLRANQVGQEGLRVAMDSGESLLSPVWREWFLIQQGSELIGQPRRRPSPLRRWLERHALWLALLGLLALGSALTLLAVVGVAWR